MRHRIQHILARPLAATLARAIVIGLMLVSLQQVRITAVDAADPGISAASELVAQLGHKEFAMRERAAVKLIALGADAAALRLGVENPDREIRYRSAKLLELVSELDLQRRFDLFKNDTDPNQDYGLPGWDSYRGVVGDSPAARAIFVSMHEDESQLLGRIQDPPRALADALSSRCDQLRGQAMFGRVQVRLGTIATLLFLSTQNDVEISPLVQSVVYMACGSSTFEDAVDTGPGREVLATLTERWIARQPLQGITYALHLGLFNDLEGCVSRAREVMQSPVASGSDRIYACLCLAKFGNSTDFPMLDGLLQDVNICAQAQVDGEVVVTEMRDLALATLVRLAKQDPKEFGFDRLVLDRRLVFNLPSLGFRDEQSRVAALESWRAYQRSQADGSR